MTMTQAEIDAMRKQLAAAEQQLNQQPVAPVQQPVAPVAPVQAPVRQQPVQQPPIQQPPATTAAPAQPMGDEKWMRDAFLNCHLPRGSALPRLGVAKFDFKRALDKQRFDWLAKHGEAGAMYVHNQLVWRFELPNELQAEADGEIAGYGLDALDAAMAEDDEADVVVGSNSDIDPEMMADAFIVGYETTDDGLRAFITCPLYSDASKPKYRKLDRKLHELLEAERKAGSNAFLMELVGKFKYALNFRDRQTGVTTPIFGGRKGGITMPDTLPA